MDFKSILNKLDSMEARAVTPAAPTIPATVQLNEDAQLRVLAGQTSFVAEAKKKKDEDMKEDMKVGDKKASSTGGTIEKTKTGIKHTAGKNYGGDKAPKDTDEDDKPAKKKKVKETAEVAARAKFQAMVEAKKKGGKPDFLDMDKDGDKEEPMKKAVADKKKNPFAKKAVKEATKTDKPWTDMSGKKHTGTAVKGDKYTGKEADKEAKAKSKKDESVVRAKAVVAESVDQKLTFKQCIQLVRESGGQQQIDAVDQELFAWAQRVAATKFNEGMQRDAFAGLTYERMGGEFKLFDVLSEDQE